MPFVVVNNEDEEFLLVGRSVRGPLQIITAPRMKNLSRFIGLALLWDPNDELLEEDSSLSDSSLRCIGCS
jgi:hypothetical protein